MCGRFVRNSSVSSIADIFNVKSILNDLPPSYNVAPTQEILIINNAGERALLKCRWGFLPPWLKDISEGGQLINARAETIDAKPSFSEAFKQRRCLIIADGFYEWNREKQRKVPYYIRSKSGKPFGFAGLYSRWTSPEGTNICTCAIITTEANELVAAIHDRMPAIVPQDKIDAWLDPKNRDLGALKAVLRPYSPEEMEMHPVSGNVNSAKPDSASNILQSCEE